MSAASKDAAARKVFETMGVGGVGASCKAITASDANRIAEKEDLRTWLPDFTLERSTVNNPLVFGSFQSGNNWGAVFSSLLNVNTPGEYTFYLELGRADTAEVLLDGIPVWKEVKCNWGSKAIPGAKHFVEAGVHSLRVVYMDDGWEDAMNAFPCKLRETFT